MESTATSTVKCPVCPHTCRKDVLGRHFTTHRNDIHSIMSKPHINYCLQNKYPLFITPDKLLAGCFACKKSVSGAGKYEYFVTRYCIDHKDCMKHFDSFRKYYSPKEPHPVDVCEGGSAGSPGNTIVYESRISDLEKAKLEQTQVIADLQAQLLEAQAARAALAAPPAPAPPSIDTKSSDDNGSKYKELYEELQVDYDSLQESYTTFKAYKTLCMKMTDVIDLLISNNKDKGTLNRAVELQSEFDEME